MPEANIIVEFYELEPFEIRISNILRIVFLFYSRMFISICKNQFDSSVCTTNVNSCNKIVAKRFNSKNLFLSHEKFEQTNFDRCEKTQQSHTCTHVLLIACLLKYRPKHTHIYTQHIVMWHLHKAGFFLPNKWTVWFYHVNKFRHCCNSIVTWQMITQTQFPHQLIHTIPNLGGFKVKFN